MLLKDTIPLNILNTMNITKEYLEQEGILEEVKDLNITGKINKNSDEEEEEEGSVIISEHTFQNEISVIGGIIAP